MDCADGVGVSQGLATGASVLWRLAKVQGELSQELVLLLGLVLRQGGTGVTRNGYHGGIGLGGGTAIVVVRHVGDVFVVYLYPNAGSGHFLRS